MKCAHFPIDMLKRFQLAEAEVAKRNRQMMAAQAELAEARKRVAEAGGIEAVQERHDEEKADRRLWRSLASVDELQKDAWKPLQCRPGSVRCMNDDCPDKGDQMWRCRFDNTLVVCDRCLEAEHARIYWPDVIDSWGPDLSDAWHRQAALPRYSDESQAQMLARAADANEWVKSRDDDDWETWNAPYCALTWLGYTSECTHSGSRSFWALKGVPGVALCSHHRDKHTDRRTMMLVLAYVVWHGAAGEPDSDGWFAAPETHWGPLDPSDRCNACDCEQDGRLVTNWYTAWRLKDGVIQHCCARCYVKWRRPRCQMCDGEFSWTDVDNLEMEDNVLHYVCGKCDSDQ